MPRENSQDVNTALVFGGRTAVFFFLFAFSQFLLGWPKSVFWFSCKIVQRTPKELFGQPNIIYNKQARGLFTCSPVTVASPLHAEASPSIGPDCDWTFLWISGDLPRRLQEKRWLWGGQRPGLELADLPFTGQVTSARGSNLEPLSFLHHRDFCVNQ